MNLIQSENYQTNSPVLFLVFNRPDVTRLTWENIKKVKPKRLYVVADGPRENRKDENELCLKVREMFKSEIDWECDYFFDFRTKNMGCKLGVSRAISWFFQNEESGIILEDDCLPTASFFKFCDELLPLYKDDDRIMQISGSNFLSSKKYHPNKNQLTYYISTINDIWGWATWRRAWNKYDIQLNNYDLFKKNKLLKNYYQNSEIYKWINQYIESSALPESKVWSTQWVYYMIVNSGYTIAPSSNLVQNIGMLGEGTNTADSFLQYQDHIGVEIEPFILQHPNEFKIRYDLDRIRFELIKKTDPAASKLRRLRVRLSKLRRKISSP